MTKTLRLIGVPLDLGAGRRGVDMGPSALRLAGIQSALEQLGHSVRDSGNVTAPGPEDRDVGNASAKYLDIIHGVCEELRLAVRDTMAAGEVPVVLGGDHSIAVGSVTGVSEHFRAAEKQIGLLWFDAHADMNTPDTSPSGNVHGMPLASVLGIGADPLVQLGGFAPKVAPENTCLIGIRDLDDREKDLVRKSGVHAYTMREIDERGMGAVASEAIQHVTNGTAGFHVSFDLDGLDPQVAPGVGTPVRGGVSWREANLLLEYVADSQAMVSFEVTELNPVLDDRNRSGEVAVEMVQSAFGKAIL